MTPVVPVRTLLASGMLALSLSTPAIAATQFKVDSFIWQKGFADGDSWLALDNVLFFDYFNDGIAPPSAPALVNGAPVSYAIRGTTDPSAVIEFDDHLWLTPSLGTVADDGDGVIYQQVRVRLNTNIDESLPAVGFNKTATHAFTAVFDLALPSAGESYGLRMRDGHISPEADDILDFTVRNFNGLLAVTWGRRAWDTPYSFLDGALPSIPGGADQIVLTLAKEEAASNAIRAYYGFYDSVSDNLIGEMTALDTVTTAFNGESFSRMELFTTLVAAPVPEPETYAMLLAGLGVIGAVARRRRQHAA